MSAHELQTKSQIELDLEAARRKKLSKLQEFDAAKYLTDEASIQAYLWFAREADNPKLLSDAEEDVIRALAANSKRHAPE
ncbi:hypothetical protein F4827_000335 [Paraburkholderia bannensis]|uniref:Uncharacterized protein n=1 Tax=Paraburkholderia bannensis TaxID=765414 RepID=A0A7W9TS59_9BURK|nr:MULTISPECIES: hypothetical protein [Paraburkholderia]MBB3255458.1 hypothetical protein [Paraburkholderia sp. WP4_3_2]MBB6100531.1 hypothetical protein [Paraburkholderia bannensis]